MSAMGHTQGMSHGCTEMCNIRSLVKHDMNVVSHILHNAEK